MINNKKHLQLNDIEAYKAAFHLSNKVWDLVLKWDHFSKNTVGIQFVRSVDSVSANLAEGFGRYSKKDKIKFYRYALGSAYESLDWNEKAKTRNLVGMKQYQEIYSDLKGLPKLINTLIKVTNTNLST
ncbi:four helix bundle protein [Tunicatimonas pelagia]|uniref:four helix bundle protein n=1 Tax=Tunicatimonas pelagia TaxID=931531 RepID=UPI002666EA2E|nr:four helix bundle protein [Tunicatimonas pelagia]WKN41187.1 four helix bundle protein [Tunicatimonas pelagia]